MHRPTKSLPPSAPLDWRRCAFSDGVLDLNLNLGERQNCSVPLMVNLYSVREQNVQLWVRSDDGVRVHLNGRFIFASPSGRWMGAGPEKIPAVSLHLGWNALRIDVVQSSGDWATAVQLMDAAGLKPADGVSYQAMPRDDLSKEPLADWRCARSDPSAGGRT